MKTLSLALLGLALLTVAGCFPVRRPVEQVTTDSVSAAAAAAEEPLAPASDETAAVAAAFGPAPREPMLPGDSVLYRHEFDAAPSAAAAGSDALNTQNVDWVSGSLFLNGNYGTGGTEEGYTAMVAVPGLDYRGFTVALHFWPVDVENRDVIIVGGTSYRWFGIVVNEGGRAAILLSNWAVPLHDLGVVVEPNRWHHVVCSVDVGAGAIRVVYDGKLLPAMSLPAGFQFNVVGTASEQADKRFTFTNYANGGTFHGYVDNLKVYGRPLTAAELAQAGG